MVTLFRVWQVVLSLFCCCLATRGVEEDPAVGQTRSHPRTSSSKDGPSSSHISMSAERDEMIQAFESTLLTMFGFNERPRPQGKRRIPEYIMDIYNRHSDVRTMDFSIEGKSTGMANTVRSFHHIEDTYDDHAATYKHRLVFNISNINEDEQLTAAELRIYRQQIPDHKIRKRHLLNDTENIEHQLVQHRINLYQILKPVARNRDVIKRLIDTALVDVRHTNWESLDIGPAVKSWATDPNTNYGVEIEVIEPRKGAPSPHGHDHIRTKRRVGQDPALDVHDEDQWFQMRPLLVTYTDDRRTKRSSKKRTKRQRGKKRRRLKPNCERHPLYVDFRVVGWHEWIVAPDGYQAFFCQGACPLPLPDHVNSTNHAIVQTIVHSAEPGLVPEVCCVPTELEPLNLLYFDERNEIIFKNYDDMIVIGCGCR